MEKKRYKLSTGLFTVRENPEFDNDKDAWNYLREKLSGKFATLYREEKFLVVYNNPEKYVEVYNSKYGPRPIGNGPDYAKLKSVNDENYSAVWIPVLEGITDDEYLVISK